MKTKKVKVKVVYVWEGEHSKDLFLETLASTEEECVRKSSDGFGHRFLGNPRRMLLIAPTRYRRLLAAERELKAREKR